MFPSINKKWQTNCWLPSPLPKGHLRKMHGFLWIYTESPSRRCQPMSHSTRKSRGLSCKRGFTKFPIQPIIENFYNFVFKTDKKLRYWYPLVIANLLWKPTRGVCTHWCIQTGSLIHVHKFSCLASACSETSTETTSNECLTAILLGHWPLAQSWWHKHFCMRTMLPYMRDWFSGKKCEECFIFHVLFFDCDGFVKMHPTPLCRVICFH